MLPSLVRFDLSRWIASAVLVALLVLAPQAALAVKLGVLGDSLSDEYGHETYSYADNWVEQLVAYRGVDAGPTGAWGEPRRNGFYEYNWARAAATSGTMLSTGQHTGLAAQVIPNGIEYGVVMIGANDQFFDGSNAYNNIYSGAWSTAQINSWVSGIVSNIDTALGTVAPTGIKLVLFNVPDYGVTPAVQAFAVNPIGRQAVADVINLQLNPQLQALAESYQVPFIDGMSLIEAMYGSHASPNTTLTIGNVDINLTQKDTVGHTLPQAGAVHDGIHPHTTLQGMLANLVLAGLNIGYGANLELFSEEEILDHAGLAYGGVDTLPEQIGSYDDYVINYVPEPNSLLLTMSGLAGLVAFRRRRRGAEHEQGTSAAL